MEDQSTPFLQKYFKTLSWAFGMEGKFNSGILSNCPWRKQLKLVAKFAPDLFMEQDKSTGNTFLNHVVDFLTADSANDSHLLHYMASQFIERLAELSIQSIHTPNIQGRTPFGYFLQHLIARRHGEIPTICVPSLSFCFCIAECQPSALASGTVASASEPPTVSQFVEAFVVLLAAEIDILTAEADDDIVTTVRAFLEHVTDDCCNNVLDHNGNTLLYIAIAKSGRRQQWSDSLLRQLLTRLMTSQAAMTRNKDGQLPIDLALEADKQPWICMALSQVAPKLLEYRKGASKLYPFQRMASSMSADHVEPSDDRHEILSTCYSLLRMAPHLVSTALLTDDANTTLLQSSHKVHCSVQTPVCR